MCAHTHTHAHTKRHPYVCTISIAVCACIARRRRLLDVGALRFCFAFGCPANKIRNTKKKSCISSLCLALFFSLLSISLVFRPAVSSLPLSLSPLLLLALCTFMLLLYLLFRCPPYQFSLSRTLLPPFSRSRSRRRRLLCLSLFIERTTALPFAPHTHTHTKTHPSSSPLPSSLCSLSLSTLFGRFARRRYVQFQPPKAENQ